MTISISSQKDGDVISGNVHLQAELGGGSQKGNHSVLSHNTDGRKSGASSSRQLVNYVPLTLKDK